MKKLLAVVKREYTQRVRSRMFIVTTVLLPFAMALFGIAPALVLSIEAGTPLRVAVFDGTGKLFDRLQEKLHNEAEKKPTPDENNPTGRSNPIEKARQQNFTLIQLATDGRSEAEQISELERRLTAKEIDAYLIIPTDLLQSGKAQFFRRNTSDLLSTGKIQDALDNAVREQRLIDAHVDARTMSDLARPVDFETTRISGTGSERDSGGGFVLVFAGGFIMYISVLLYGQVVLGAVIEEKETRIAEVLFSSVRPFTLMMGKLLGVSLVALTQLAIWGLAFGAFALYGVSVLASKGVPTNIPRVPLIFLVYFVLFFLVGYFVYSTLYALVGSIVTTSQEGGQLAMPIIVLLVISFYLFLPVSRNPDSSVSFWLSMIPFFAPVSMVVRIVTQTPPFWQIALSLIIGFSTAALLTWVSARIYRIGMLMYGKRPTIPELVRWVRQA
jgi:ABC-2 type transport system permease protein